LPQENEKRANSIFVKANETFYYITPTFYFCTILFIEDEVGVLSTLDERTFGCSCSNSGGSGCFLDTRSLGLGQKSSLLGSRHRGSFLNEGKFIRFRSSSRGSRRRGFSVVLFLLIHLDYSGLFDEKLSLLGSRWLGSRGSCSLQRVIKSIKNI
jgi:hypothetical protein